MMFNIEEGLSAPELLVRASEHFGEGLVFTTAFGLEGSALLHMIAREKLPIRVVTLDTGLLFEETRRAWQRLESELGLRIEGVLPTLTLDQQASLHGSELWLRHPDRCCDLRKVQPLRQVLSEATAWITGIRRSQSHERAHAPKAGWDERFEVVKLNPLADWSTKDVRAYLEENEVPYNPMFDDGYPSIGCAPCTRRVSPDEDERAGRWAGFDKRECGLHWAPGPDGKPRLQREASS